MKTVVKYSLVVWLVFSLIIISIMSPFNPLDITIIRVGSLIIPMMCLFYLNLVYLAPHYLDKNKRTQYFVFLGIAILIYTISMVYVDITFDRIYPISIHDFTKRPLAIAFFGRFMSAVPPIVVSALINRSMLLQKQNAEKLELENKMLEAETKALKAQINPHFLFNSLNNIYSLSQSKSDKTPDAILQLSEILRYVTYDGNQKLVDLNEEIQVIKNFIELQRLKDEHLDNVKIDINISTKGLKIAPLLLIPFIENSFKHSNFEDKEKGWITISISTEGNKLKLISSNSSTHSLYQSKDKVGGVGMDNVKKRLNLLYPERHQLHLKMDKSSYSVELNIDLEV